jgi:hypothetical protein
MLLNVDSAALTNVIDHQRMFVSQLVITSTQDIFTGETEIDHSDGSSHYRDDTIDNLISLDYSIEPIVDNTTWVMDRETASKIAACFEAHGYNLYKQYPEPPNSLFGNRITIVKNASMCDYELGGYTVVLAQDEWMELIKYSNIIWIISERGGGLKMNPSYLHEDVLRTYHLMDARAFLYPKIQVVEFRNVLPNELISIQEYVSELRCFVNSRFLNYI